MLKNRGIIVVLFAGVFLCCETPFSYSVYDAYVPAQYRGLTSKNLKKLDEVSGQPLSRFKVALLADVHYHYDDLAIYSGLTRMIQFCFLSLLVTLPTRGF